MLLIFFLGGGGVEQMVIGIKFVHCIPPKSPIDLSCHKTDVKILIKSFFPLMYITVFYGERGWPSG